MSFNFQENYILENERICLRPLIITDFDFLIEYSLNEPDIWKFNAGGPDSAENLKRYIEDTINQRKNKKEYPFIVYDKTAKRYIGSTRFYDIRIENKTLSLGYTWYGKQFQGTHVNKNCKYLMLQFAFEKIGVERVEFRANAKNERSISAMKNIGCTAEGVLRNCATDLAGDRIDMVVLSILKTDWQIKVKSLLKSKISS